MSESNQTATTKNELFLPDGTKTSAQPFDVIVWEKNVGVMYMQRPSVGRLGAPFDGHKLPTDEAAVRELVDIIHVADAIGLLRLANIRLFDESSDRIIFEFLKPESGF